MLKPVLGLATTGVVAFILWKLVALFVLPLVGITIALAVMVIKFAFIAMVVMFAIWLLRRMNGREAGTA